MFFLFLSLNSKFRTIKKIKRCGKNLLRAITSSKTRLLKCLKNENLQIINFIYSHLLNGYLDNQFCRHFFHSSNKNVSVYNCEHNIIIYIYFSHFVRKYYSSDILSTNSI